MGEWGAWTKDHAKMILDTNSAGKTKLVTTSGVSDFRNDIMLYSIVEAAHRTKRRRKPSKTIRICKFRKHPFRSWKSGR